MPAFDESTPLSKVDLCDSRVLQRITELLPPAARVTYATDGMVPAGLLQAVGDGLQGGTVADLVLGLSIEVTDGRSVREVTVDTSAVRLVPAAFGTEPPEHLRDGRGCLST
jgi:hypothetical protein